MVASCLALALSESEDLVLYFVRNHPGYERAFGDELAIASLKLNLGDSARNRSLDLLLNRRQNLNLSARPVRKGNEQEKTKSDAKNERAMLLKQPAYSFCNLLRSALLIGFRLPQDRARRCREFPTSRAGA